MLRVLHISPTYYDPVSVVGGGEKYIVYQCKALETAAKAVGADIEQVIVGFSEKGERGAIVDGVRIEVHRGVPWDPKSLDARSLRLLASQFDAIIVHQCLTHFGLFVGAQCRIACPIVLGMDHGGGEHRLAYRSPEVGEIYDLLIAQSTFAASFFADLQTKVAVIPGPVDTKTFRPLHGNVERTNLIVTLGRYMPHKGMDRVVAAIPKNQPIVLMGTRVNAEYFDYLVKLSRGKAVKFAEGLSDDDVLETIQQAGLCVHASTHVDYKGAYYAKPELLGLAPLEALSCGTPTFVSNAGSLGELGVIKGCKVFGSDEELQEMLLDFSSGGLSFPSPLEIHDDVVSKMGLGTYGSKLLAELVALVRS
jgi:glycosyltransferase involved in cell wall biosynthesis